MKKILVCLLAGVMILSLAACTPTTEKNKTGQTKATNGVDTVKNPDPTAPDLDVVSIYTVSADGSKLEGTMDAIEGKTAQTLVDSLIEYGVLGEGTTAISFTAEGELSSEEVGPGIIKIPGFEIPSNSREYGTLNLSAVPDEKDDMALHAIANTFIENMAVTYMTIQVDGETVAENYTFMEVGK
ncbi:MAG: hypothetical protein LUC99_02070 [Clostridiales bacterium]|nr:hypothetical protein [Clostridiales bacterium]